MNCFFPPHQQHDAQRHHASRTEVRNAWASLSSSSLFSSMKKTKASHRVRLCARLGSAEPRPSARCETNDTRGDRIRGAGDATRVWEYASAMWRYVLLPPCHSASDHLRQSCSAAAEDHTLWACAFVTGAEQRHSFHLPSEYAVRYARGHHRAMALFVTPRSGGGTRAQQCTLPPWRDHPPKFPRAERS
jgi:hypothetical protein